MTSIHERLGITPGPWQTQNRTLTIYTTTDPIKRTGITNAIAATCRKSTDAGSLVPQKEAKANARVIAAVPEMLEKLEAVSKIDHLYPDGHTQEWVYDEYNKAIEGVRALLERLEQG